MIWDLKARVNPSNNQKSALSNLIQQTGNPKSHQYFTDLNAPHRSYIDARLDINSQDAQIFFQDYLNSNNGLGIDTRKALGFIDQLRIITSDGKEMEWTKGAQDLKEVQ